MRKLFTGSQSGLTSDKLRWGERQGRWRRVQQGVYAEGPEEPSALERQVARVIAAGGVASGRLAGVLHGLDGLTLDERPLRRRTISPERVKVVHGVRCTDGPQTLVDLAAVLDDTRWEQALESGLRKRLVTVEQLAGVHRAWGSSRIRRVLALRPPNAPATGSLLETLMVQLVRPVLPDPVRQLRIENAYGDFVAYLDLAWPQPGVFLELDGEQHKGQPVYDARRETAVVAATGWLPGRFTWTEVVRFPKATRARAVALVDRAGIARSA